jgi:purine-nucleoside phosphorylase
MTIPASTYADLASASLAMPPVAAIVAGSGLGAVAERVRPLVRVAYGDVPGMAPTSVAGHQGCLTLGEWCGQHVLVFDGRLHYYEGHPWSRVVRPAEISSALGARVLLQSNAAGGIHEALVPGSLMAIRDHIEWTRPYCWRSVPGIGPMSPIGPMVPARPSPYSPGLRVLLRQAANDLGITLQEGVYAAVTGPSYETPAEIRALKKWGADAVGMSTAREAQAAFDLGLECVAVSLITNRAAGLSVGPITHGEVLATAAESAERLGTLIERFVQAL